MPKVIVERLPRNRKLQLTRPGYKDKNFTLVYQKTDEKWAEGRSEWFATGERSASILLLPTNTYEVFSLLGDSVSAMFRGDIKDPLMALGMSFLIMPAAVFVDIYNIFIGLPSTAVINPWHNYRIQENPKENISEWQKI